MFREKIISLYERFLDSQFCKGNRLWWINNCKRNGIDPYKPQKGEEQYLALWHKVSPKVEPYTYRFFSHRMGQVPYIVPESIGHLFLERYLNPLRYQSFYSDKNAYNMYLDSSVSPKILISRINGSRLMDENFRLIEKFSNNIRTITAANISEVLAQYDKVCLKPSIDTDSGTGVLLFSKGADALFKTIDGTVLSGEFLNGYGTNFNIQEVLAQHPYLAQFNDTSVNTLRLSVYRSVVDERLHVNGAFLRIGVKGSFVYNVHAGGRFVGIDTATGKLQKTTLDQYGTRRAEWNGIDFSKTDFTIPQWDKITAFAKMLASHNIHMRLHSMDISMDCSGTPKMIEMNFGGFAYWMHMMCGQDVFNGEVEDVIVYCNKQRQNTRKHLRILDIYPPTPR